MGRRAGDIVKLRLPDRAILADLRQALLVSDPVERAYWVGLAVPDVDPEVARELLYTAEACRAARKLLQADRRLYDLLWLQRDAEAKTWPSRPAPDPGDNPTESVDNPVENPVDNWS